MLDYGELLRFLADNPPRDDMERRVHASLLELIATSMRDEEPDRIASLAELRARYTGAERPLQQRH
ncbi:MAG: hypothetical protein ACR2O4_17500 [Hyphomicrobiaceae bacterium]